MIHLFPIYNDIGLKRVPEMKVYSEMNWNTPEQHP